MSIPVPPPGPTAKTTYTLAVCLFHHFTTLDYQGPIEILTMYSTSNRKNYGSLFETLPDSAIDAEFLSHSMELVEPMIGPKVLPTRTYKDAMEQGRQFDIILIPGGEENLNIIFTQIER